MRKQKIVSPLTIAAYQHNLTPEHIQPAALEVVYKLQDAGFAAYLVGGCVRDLLAGVNPKDFDVATNALPEEIKALFRRSFIIGKRFRLVHVYIGREIIEVATFRKNPGETAESQYHNTGKLIIRDNAFGSMEEDAWRRDFTSNALYYDPRENTIIDYCGGLADIHQRQLRMIGNPQQRYQEDPVRMLRGIRLSAKLDFALAADTAAPIKHCGHLLQQVSAARLLDEILKMFLQGHGQKTFKLCLQYDLFQYLFPLTARHMQKKSHLPIRNFIMRALVNCDQRLAVGKTITPTFFLAVVLWYPLLFELQEALPFHRHEGAAFESAIREIITHQQKTTTLARHVLNGVFDIWRLQWRMRKTRPASIFRVLHHLRFRAAYDFLLLRADIHPHLEPFAQWWTSFYAADPETQRVMIKTLAEKDIPPFEV